MDRAAMDALKFDEQGLIPAVLQDWRDGTVLMVAYMNREACISGADRDNPCGRRARPLGIDSACERSLPTAIRTPC